MEKKTKIIKDLQQEVRHPSFTWVFFSFLTLLIFSLCLHEVLIEEEFLTDWSGSLFLCLHSFLFNGFCVCQTPSGNFQRDSWLLSANTSQTLAWKHLFYRVVYVGDTGVCFWSWLQSWLLWLVSVDKLVPSFPAMNSLCMIVEHGCKIVCLKWFSFLFDAEGLTPKSDISNWCRRHSGE